MDTSKPLEKKISSGFQPTSDVAGVVLGELPDDRFAPGLIKVNRWTIGSDRIVEPPSVAAATEGTVDMTECAV